MASNEGVGVLWGREAEVERIGALLDSAREASGGVVIDGQAGIGKTALLEVAVDHARDGEFRIIAARPTRAETPLAFAALTDLLHGVDFALLPAAQRRVLEIALGRRENDGQPPLANELGMAVVQLVEALTLDGPPLVVVVDDLQWIDAASREVLTFAMRRLPPAGVCVLVAQRDPATDTIPSNGDSIHDAPSADFEFFDVPEAIRITLRALPPDSIERLVRGSLAAQLPVHILNRVIDVAGGNPLFAIELGRAMSDAVMHPGRPLPVPASLASVVAGRFHTLPARTVEALAAVALLARPSLGELADLDLVDDLQPAEVAGIVEIRGRQIAFTHPLLASAAHDALPGTQRLAMHRRLADVTRGTERCIHLALGSTHPDAAVAAELTAAVVVEVDRGATAEAAELAMLALDATPTTDALRWERMIFVGDVLFRAGRTEEAIAQITAARDNAPVPMVRAKALLGLATIEYSRSDDAEAAAVLAREVLGSTDDPDLLAEAHTILARVLYTDFVEAAEHADAALAIIRGRDFPDPLALAQALNASATARFLAGDGLDREAFAMAIDLERNSIGPVADSAYASLAALLKYADELHEAQAMLESLTERADPGSLPYALGHLPQLHLWAGRWDEAERCAQRHLTLAEETHQDSQVQAARFNLAIVAAYRGEVGEAEPLGRGLYDEGRAAGVPWTERNGAALLGFLAMTTGDAESAATYFARYDELGEMMRLHEPGYARFHGDYVEALVAIGDTARATSVIDRIEIRAVRTQRVSALAAVHRGRALVAAHEGDRDDAFAAARQAVATLVGTPLAYERARAMLTLGIVARRFKERAVAREALSEALGQFEQMGAASLAERARRELDRVGGRVGAGPTDLSALTATEASVAELAAAGRTTRQIADSLFISTKTVEANLTRIYRKLGLANRAQLANHLATPPQP
jgi:DNA-binding CsgD family transcriptional regulator